MSKAPLWIHVGAIARETGTRGIESLRIIVRITPTQIVLDNGSRYRINDLRKVGENLSTYEVDHGHATRLEPGEGVIRDAVRDTVRGIADEVDAEIRAGADPFDATQARLEAAITELADVRRSAQAVHARAAEIAGA